MSSLPPAPACDTPGIYRQIVGDDFESIGTPLREFLDQMGCVSALGSFDVRRHGGLFGAVLGVILRFPRPGTSIPLALTVQRTPTSETWNRDFAGRQLRSHHIRHERYLVETVGPAKIYHTLSVDGQSLRHQSDRTSVWGIRLPRVLSPEVTAIGTPTESGWKASVEIAFPLIGMILAYRGNVAVVK